MDAVKLQYILELITQGNFQAAKKELEDLNVATAKATQVTAAQAETITKTTTATKQHAEETDKSGAAQAGLATSVVGTIGKYLVWGKILQETITLTRESVKAFEEKQDAIKGLNATLLSNGQFTKDYSESLVSHANALEDDLNVASTKIIGIQTTLSSFKANPDNINELTQAVLDLSAAGDNAKGTAENLGAALEGNFAPIERQLKIHLDETASNGEKLAKVMEVIKTRVGGLAAANSTTTSGLREMANATGSLMEGFGGLIATGIKPYVAVMTDAIKSTTDFVQWLNLAGQSMGKTNADLDLLTTTIARRNDLTSKVMAAMADGTVSASQGEAMKALLRQTSTDPNEMNRRIVQVQYALGSGTPLPTADNSGNHNPAQAAKAMKDLQDAQALSRARLLPGNQSAAGGLGQSDVALFQKNADALIAKLDQLADKGVITETEFKDAVSGVTQDFQVNAAQISMQGYQEMLKLSDYSKGELQAQLNEVERTYEARKQVLTSYYDESERRILQDTRLTQTQKQSSIEGLRQQQAQMEVILQSQQNLEALDARLKQIGLSSEGVSRQLATGFTNAFASITNGSKSAGQATKELFANMLQYFAQAIQQAIIFNFVMGLIKGVVGAAGSSGGGVSAGNVSGGGLDFNSGENFPIGSYAAGGVLQRFAAGGVTELSGPTVFPGIGALAGENGREIHAFIKGPITRFGSGGLTGLTGEAAGRKVALLNLDGAGGREAAPAGVSGSALIRVEAEPGFRVRIIDDSIEGARIAVHSDMQQDTPISRSTRELSRG